MSAAASSNGGKEEAELTQAVDKFFDLLQVCESEEGERSTREGGRKDVHSMGCACVGGVDSLLM